MFVRTALCSQQHTPTSSAHSCEQSVTKHQIISVDKRNQQDVTFFILYFSSNSSL